MGTEALTFSDAELKVLRSQYAELTDVEFDAFLAAAGRYQLNPLANQIYARLQRATQKNPRRISYTAQIDGYRLIADRTGQYAGNDDPVFDSEAKPSKATVTVYKIVGGERCPFTASARMSQYRPAGNAAFMWDRMPHLMLGKTAEALALRKAFPVALSGIYTVEEMQQADDHDEPKSAPPAKPAEKPKVELPPAPRLTADTDLGAWERHEAAAYIAHCRTSGELLELLNRMAACTEWAANMEDWPWLCKLITEAYRLILKHKPEEVNDEFVFQMKKHAEAINSMANDPFQHPVETTQQ